MIVAPAKEARYVRPLVFVASLVLSTLTLGAEIAPPSPADPGPWPVGFRLVEQVDASRSDTGSDQGRPVQTLVWYPAARAGQPMRYEDYLELGSAENDFSRTPAERRRRTDAALGIYTVLGTSPDAIASWRAAPVRASRDATSADGRFPVVIYAASDSSPAYENDWLCEYLASHGYVVLASPSHGADGGYMTDGRLPQDLANTRAQAADIGFLIGFARSMPFADTTHLAVVGYSWGGLSATFAAMADKRIRAIVAWDGSMRYFSKLMHAAPDIAPEAFTTPMLFIADREDPIPPARDAWPHSFITRMPHADLILVGMKRLFHPDLAAQSLRLGSMAKHDDTTLDQRLASYAWMERYTLAFLDERLKSDASAQTFLDATPEENHVPPGTLTSIRRRATSSLGTIADMAPHLFAERADPQTVHDDYVRKHPGFQIAGDTYSSWLSSLLADGDISQAATVAALWTTRLPQSGEAWTMRAAIEDTQGQRDNAIRDYRHALQLDPNNPIGKRRLQTLTSTPP
ncbi:MAG: hypothetical protein GAK28_00494 [Luteibacter sp.]|nr:MAG: hypothetical protein GAK28_00494 [Luteibacter sp.]